MPNNWYSWLLFEKNVGFFSCCWSEQDLTWLSSVVIDTLLSVKICWCLYLWMSQACNCMLRMRIFLFMDCLWCYCWICENLFIYGLFVMLLLNLWNLVIIHDECQRLTLFQWKTFVCYHEKLVEKTYDLSSQSSYIHC